MNRKKEGVLDSSEKEGKGKGDQKERNEGGRKKKGIGGK